jgi:hypothetical protein
MRFLLTFFRAIGGKQLMCEECPLSLTRNVAKAVQADSAFHPNQDGNSHDAMCRSTLFYTSSVSTFAHGGKFAVSIPFSRLQ